MSLKLYTTPLSPPCRSVLLCEQALNLRMEHIEINLMESEQMKPEILKLNPQHTIPILVDNDVIICDSHAIMAYLVEEYGSDSDLYPRDLKKRSLVDHRLHFDSGCIFSLLRRIVEAKLDKSSIETDSICTALAHRYYKFLDEFLIDQNWVCGSNITIADLSLIPSITSLDVLVPIGKCYGNITGWLQRSKELPYYCTNNEGLDAFKHFVQCIIS